MKKVKKHLETEIKVDSQIFKRKKQVRMFLFAIVRCLPALIYILI
jgi:hypothetical protein